jgi:enoyl-CoA hydratase/carnithine racemase
MEAHMVRITLDGPGMNALGTAVMSKLRDDLRAAAGEPILLTGAGRAFSAGLDLKEVASLDAEGMTRFLDLLEQVVGMLYHHPAPTVAFVNGHAIAGGAVLALATDRRICAEGRLRVGLNEVAIGLRFPPRTLQVVVRQLPAHHAHEVLLGAHLSDPDDALRVGLVDELGDLAQAEAVLAQLAANPSDAYAATKAALRPPTDVSAAERQAFIDQVVPVWTAPELKQRLRNLLG